MKRVAPLALQSVLWWIDAAQPNKMHTSQVYGHRRCAEERGGFTVELKVLRALAPAPSIAWKYGLHCVGMQDVLSPRLEVQ